MSDRKSDTQDRLDGLVLPNQEAGHGAPWTNSIQPDGFGKPEDEGKQEEGSVLLLPKSGQDINLGGEFVPKAGRWAGPGSHLWGFLDSYLIISE